MTNSHTLKNKIIVVVWVHNEPLGFMSLNTEFPAGVLLGKTGELLVGCNPAGGKGSLGLGVGLDSLTPLPSRSLPDKGCNQICCLTFPIPNLPQDGQPPF